MGEKRIKCTVIVQEEDYWYHASCVENNLTANGGTVEEAVDNLIETLAVCFDNDEPAPEYKPVFITTIEIVI